MKKIRLFTMLFSAALLLAACVGEEKDLFDKTAAERLQQTQNQYTQHLQGTTWAMEYYPIVSDEAPKGLGYLMLVRFNTNGTVTIGMKHKRFRNRYNEDTSLWEIITDQGMVLSFNTYNEVLHTFSDPGESDSDKLSQGQGYEGDYEFVMVDVPEDGKTMMLKGKKRGTYVRMTRLPDDTDFEAYLTDVNDFHARIFAENAINENVLVIGGKKQAIHSGSTGILQMYPYGGDAIVETTAHPFLITKRDGQFYLRFRSALKVNEVEEQEFVYDEASQRFTGLTSAENLVEGDNANTFFANWLKGKHRWALVNNATAQQMSESMKAIYDAAAATLGATSAKWAFVSVILAQQDEQLICDIVLRNNRNQRTTLNYAYKLTASEQNVSIAYEGPTDTNVASRTMLDSAPTLKAFVEAIAGSYSVSTGTSSPFLLNTLRLTDGDKWFNLNSVN